VFREALFIRLWLAQVAGRPRRLVRRGGDPHKGVALVEQIDVAGIGEAIDHRARDCLKALADGQCVVERNTQLCCEVLPSEP
jgi:hypothetical protein